MKRAIPDRFAKTGWYSIADVNGDAKNEIIITDSLDNTLNIVKTGK